MIADERGHRSTPVQVAGMFLWRGGLMLVASYSLFRLARLMLTFVDIAPQLQVGFSLMLAGVAMVIASLILERFEDERQHKEAPE